VRDLRQRAVRLLDVIFGRVARDYGGW